MILLGRVTAITLFYQEHRRVTGKTEWRTELEKTLVMQSVAVVAEIEKEDKEEDQDQGHLDVVIRAEGPDLETAGGGVEAVVEDIGGGRVADTEAEAEEALGGDGVTG